MRNEYVCAFQSPLSPSVLLATGPMQSLSLSPVILRSPHAQKKEEGERERERERARESQIWPPPEEGRAR